MCQEALVFERCWTHPRVQLQAIQAATTHASRPRVIRRRAHATRGASRATHRAELATAGGAAHAAPGRHGTRRGSRARRRPRSLRGLGPDVSGVNLLFSHVSSQTRIANHFAVAPSVHGMPHLHGWMELIKPHPTIYEAPSADHDTRKYRYHKVRIWRADAVNLTLG